MEGLQQRVHKLFFCGELQKFNDLIYNLIEFVNFYKHGLYKCGLGKPNSHVKCLRSEAHVSKDYPHLTLVVKIQFTYMMSLLKFLHHLQLTCWEF